MFSFCLLVFYFCFGSDLPNGKIGDKARAYFFDVGQGHCFLFVAKKTGFLGADGEPADVVILIDAGSSSIPRLDIPSLVKKSYNWVSDINGTMRKYIGPKTQVLVIVTHGDQDHYNLIGSLDCLKYKRIRTETDDETGEETGVISAPIDYSKQLWILGGNAKDYFSAGRDGIVHKSSLPQCVTETGSFTAAVRDGLPGCTIKGIKEGTEVDAITFPKMLCFNGAAIYPSPAVSTDPKIKIINDRIIEHLSSARDFVSVTVLSAENNNDGTDEGKNQSSIVTRIECKHRSDVEGVSFMIAGDASGDVTDKIKSLGVKSTVLLASHHGATTHGSNNEHWFQAVHPKYVVFSHGDRRDYLHPHIGAMRQAWKCLQGDVKVQDHVLFCGEQRKEADTAGLAVVDRRLSLHSSGDKRYFHTVARLCNKFIGCPNSTHNVRCLDTCKDRFGCGDVKDGRVSHRDCDDCVQNNGYDMMLTNCGIVSTYTQGHILFTVNSTGLEEIFWKKEIGVQLGQNPAKILRWYLKGTKLASYVREIYLNHPILARAFLQWGIQITDMPCLKMVDFTGVTFDSSVVAASVVVTSSVDDASQQAAEDDEDSGIVVAPSTSVDDASQQDEEGDDAVSVVTAVEDVAQQAEDAEDSWTVAAASVPISRAQLQTFGRLFTGITIKGVPLIPTASTTDAVASGAGAKAEDVVNKLNPRNRRQQFYRNRNRACALITKGRRFSHG